MTVSELITALQVYDKDAQVHIGTTEYVIQLELYDIKGDTLHNAECDENIVIFDIGDDND